MPLILTETLVEIPDDWYLFFLIGPVRGGGDWQHPGYQMLMEGAGDKCAIAIPVRYKDFPGHPLLRAALPGMEGRFPSQTLWERYYIELGLRRPRSCVLAWLGRESETNPRPPGAGPNGQDTYGEIGRYVRDTKYRPDNRLVLGADPEFPGLSAIRKNLVEDVGNKFPIYPSLQATVEAAFHLAGVQ